MRRTGLLIMTPSAVAGALLPALAAAWTPYDYGPPWSMGPPDAMAPAEQGAAGGPADMPEAPQMPPQVPPQMPDYGSGSPVGHGPFPGYVPPGYGDFGPPWQGGNGAPWGPDAAPGYEYGPPGMVPGYGPGYGPASGGEHQGMPSEGGTPSDGVGSGSGPYPGYPEPPPRHRGGGLRVSQTMTDDAYVLEIPLDGQRPESIQVEPQGHGLLIRRDNSAQVSEESRFDDGRGYARRYSYSTGRTSRRLSVPRDGDLAALSREDGPDSIVIRIPRHQP
ncbi:molecular chaperone (small heat shock protein) [Thioflavicoccus mobilis 8321]|uniref:Molecular chaperone (Small heat shock protein) n=1 Tax=Thioflavicoccus mobilis 8321 TaxID=765912 RepID=L0H3E7_9GAMM|nr:Hsp20/alpha crystallin family protein [Thioflavicoccus mobilis]AGA92109.1 molecular chaperone (small heat shock protein) [Thioflavicoccus mobilis 8321]